MAKNARNGALYILNRLDKKDETLDRILEDYFNKHSFSDRREISLLYAIVFGVLRWRARLDWIIESFSKIKLRKIDAKVLNVLRIGLFQIVYLDRIPTSAAVNTSVELAKSIAPFWVVNFVNALLRKAAKSYHNVVFPDFKTRPVDSLTANQSFPKWLIKRWVSRFGPNEAKALCEAINKIPPITLRVNTLKTTREKLICDIKCEVKTLQRASISDCGIHAFGMEKTLAQTNAFKKGLFQVQDEAAQLVTMFLNPKPGEDVLDACAGLGGKSGHIAQCMKNKGRLVTIDKNHEKTQDLALELKRLGFTNITPLVYDLNKPIKGLSPNIFDRVLLDAPCSGLGVLRRNPDAKWKPKKKKLNSFHHSQRAFLENISSFVKPNGIIVYCVCSMEPEENDEVVLSFLEKHKEFKIDEAPKKFPKKAPYIIDDKGYLRTFPHLHHMDGFFAVRLRRL